MLDESFADFRLRAEFSGGSESSAIVIGDNAARVPLHGAGEIEIIWDHPPGEAARYQVTRKGEPPSGIIELAGSASANEPARFASTQDQAHDLFRWDRDFTAVVRFRAEGNGTLVSRAPADGKWAPNGKTFFLRGGRLVYDIGWVGAVTARPAAADGEWHTAAVRTTDGDAEIWLDGAKAAGRNDFSSPDEDGHVFKIGSTSPNFGGDLEDGEIAWVRWYRRALPDDEMTALTGGAADAANTADFEWRDDAEGRRPLADGFAESSVPVTIAIDPGDGILLGSLRIQALGDADHAELIAASDDAAFERGAKIYQTLCVTCHGTLEAPGTLPTALRFGEGEFKNGSDPYRMFRTLADGFGLMVPQVQYTARQKYDVIHFIREGFLREHNPSQFAKVDGRYLESLPRRRLREDAQEAALADAADEAPRYEQMDFGPALFWTLQVAPENIAQKAIAIRLNAGDGGVTRGRAWMIYDHDTMRVAGAFAGGQLLDWRGIAFDGSHGTHTGVTADSVFLNPVGPGWASGDGSWNDPRLEGRDGRRYGPMPRDWVKYGGLYLEGGRAVIAFRVGGVPVLESPGMIDYGAAPAFVRILQVGPSENDLALRVAAADDPNLAIAVRGDADRADLAVKNGCVIFRIPAAPATRRLALITAAMPPDSLEALVGSTFAIPNLDDFTNGDGQQRWAEPVTTESTVLHADGPFAVDDLTVPDGDASPWRSWMRLGGIDFLDADTAAVCTWMGDVWIVEGISSPAPAELRWQRIASGLFQPLGVKVVDGRIFVSCRDQIAEIVDLDGDREADFIRCFNSDHQVTEHFHEFAMGLQTDAEGNFYYAKSARHALPAVVPHHGTLLRVAADGSRTDILATGFRAANGVCLNPDGTFFVTDQEGHWTPKNRINLVREGGYYGNQLGYHDVTDESDSAMSEPLAWITNAFDRSPSELLWVPDDAWGSLAGALLNLSYGYGKIFTVAHERLANGGAHGVLCALPIPPFPTGVMRGRLHPETGDLFVCGLFAWGGNQQAEPGGLYRIRRTGHPAHVTTGFAADDGSIALTFSDPLDPAAADPSRLAVRAWDLERSARYGSPHINERELQVAGVELSSDRRTLRLDIPNLAPTRGLAITARLVTPVGREITREIHGSLR